jgi:hypothetical protein
MPFHFLTNNIEGDDQNVFPYINYDTWDRFDCSKLDQWEMVFDHGQKLGLFLHFKTLESEIRDYSILAVLVEIQDFITAAHCQVWAPPCIELEPW